MADFINADVKIDKFNEIIDIANRTASDLKPAMAAIVLPQLIKSSYKTTISHEKGTN
ncbi:MAG: hypothetical protein IKB43_11665 [Fibrobacter sp.]|nr:hypothetical protein [Fibrobacter sp.]